MAGASPALNHRHRCGSGHLARVLHTPPKRCQGCRSHPAELLREGRWEQTGAPGHRVPDPFPAQNPQKRGRSCPWAQRQPLPPQPPPGTGVSGGGRLPATGWGSFGLGLQSCHSSPQERVRDFWVLRVGRGQLKNVFPSGHRRPC